MSKVTMSQVDVDSVRNFAKHFSVDISDELDKVMTAFSNNQTYENQELYKLEFCKWMVNSKWAGFLDALWAAPLRGCREYIEKCSNQP